MRIERRAAISVSAAIVLALGSVGVGCKKAQPKDPGTVSSTIGVENTASTHTSPDEIAKAELAKGDLAKSGNSVSGATTPGTVAGTAGAKTDTANGAAPGATTKADTVAQTPVLPPQPTCFTETFYHKPMAGHSDEEACSHHKNLLVLSHKDVNPAHVCVRVNGTPVKFQRKGEEVLIGAIAGPKAKITVRYCTGKLTCAEVSKEDCTVPKDEFMDALGGGAADDTVQWDSAGANAENAKLNDEVKKELADIDGVDTNEKGRNPAQANIFKDWIRQEDAPACAAKKQSS